MVVRWWCSLLGAKWTVAWAADLTGIVRTGEAGKAELPVFEESPACAHLGRLVTVIGKVSVTVGQLLQVAEGTGRLGHQGADESRRHGGGIGLGLGHHRGDDGRLLLLYCCSDGGVSLNGSHGDIGHGNHRQGDRRRRRRTAAGTNDGRRDNWQCCLA